MTQGRLGKREGRDGYMIDTSSLLWGMSNGPTRAGKPTQRQLRVKDKIFDELFSSPSPLGPNGTGVSGYRWDRV